LSFLLYVPHVPSISSSLILSTNFMEQSPSWEANRFSGSQEIPRILWNPEVHYRIPQKPATCPCSQPYQFSPCPIPLLEDPF
jgi:hypothetical protein